MNDYKKQSCCHGNVNKVYYACACADVFDRSKQRHWPTCLKAVFFLIRIICIGRAIWYCYGYCAVYPFSKRKHNVHKKEVYRDDYFVFWKFCSVAYFHLKQAAHSRRLKHLQPYSESIPHLAVPSSGLFVLAWGEKEKEESCICKAILFCKCLVLLCWIKLLRVDISDISFIRMHVLKVLKLHHK